MTNFRTQCIDGDYRKNPKTQFYCCACQKDMDPAKPCFAVHLVEGGPYVLHPGDEAAYQADALANGQQPGELGCFPIGNDCAKKLGIEWCHPKAIWPEAHR